MEALRQQICENDKFDTWECFKTLDRLNHGFITISDLKTFFIKNHVAIYEKETEFLIYECSKNQKYMDFQDMLKMILPRQNLEIREACLCRRKYFPKNQAIKMPFYLEELIAKIFEEELIFLREVEQQKLEIMNRYGWNLRQAFQIITEDKSECIDKKIMFKFMGKKCNGQYKEEDFIFFLSRFDSDRNNNISIEEFCQTLFPSDFITENIRKHDYQGSFFRFIRGSQKDLIEYLNGERQPIETGVPQYNPEHFRVHNDVEQYQTQQRYLTNTGTNINLENLQQQQQIIQSEQMHHKFLRTNKKFEKSAGNFFQINQTNTMRNTHDSEHQAEMHQFEQDQQFSHQTQQPPSIDPLDAQIPLLNKYMINRSTNQPYSNKFENEEEDNFLPQTNRYITNQQKLFMSDQKEEEEVDFNFSPDKQRELGKNEQINQPRIQQIPQKLSFDLNGQQGASQKSIYQSYSSPTQQFQQYQMPLNNDNKNMFMNQNNFYPSNDNQSKKQQIYSQPTQNQYQYLSPNNFQTQQPQQSMINKQNQLQNNYSSPFQQDDFTQSQYNQ